MKREILFRGKRVDNGEWVYGLLTHDLNDKTENCLSISPNWTTFNEVIPETVGQFTGLMDKNGNKIFEGETCKILYSDWVSKLDSDPRTLDQYLDDISHEGEIVWDDESNGWGIRIYSKKYDEYSILGINYGKHGHIKITSNIHDNPTT